MPNKFLHFTIHARGAGRTVLRVLVDGTEQAEPFVPLLDDRNDHYVEVEVG